MNTKYNKQAGITLLEMVITMIAVAILIPVLVSGISFIGGSLSVNDEISRSVAHAQECAEHILAIKRDSSLGFATLDAATDHCATDLPAAAGLTITSTITDRLPTFGDCPANATNCKEVLIVVSTNGADRAEINLILME